MVSVHSDGDGRGSAFVVRLPITEEAVRADDRVPAAQACSPRRILLVEDHTDSRDMLRLLLEAHGHSVVEAHDGPGAVAVAEQASPEIALVDLGLPGFDGYEVARRIREISAERRITLVALTGYGQPEHQQRAIAAGFDAHLTKPVELGDLEPVFSRWA